MSPQNDGLLVRSRLEASDEITKPILCQSSMNLTSPTDLQIYLKAVGVHSNEIARPFGVESLNRLVSLKVFVT